MATLISFPEGKEDHVWMDLKGFEEYSVGDSLEFFAEVYRYLKTSNGKLIDYGLRNPEGIKRVEEYELPSDDDLLRQEINFLICETCILGEPCSRMNCIANPKEKKRLKKEMFDLTKACDEGRN